MKKDLKNLSDIELKILSDALYIINVYYDDFQRDLSDELKKIDYDDFCDMSNDLRHKVDELIEVRKDYAYEE